MGGDKFKISLDTTKDPHEINLQDVDADYRVFRGIYEFAFDDDQLRISFAHWDRSADSPTHAPRPSIPITRISSISCCKSRSPSPLAAPIVFAV